MASFGSTLVILALAVAPAAASPQPAACRGPACAASASDANTPAFRYYAWIKGDGSDNRLEIKLSNVSGETFWYHLPLDFTDWRVVSVHYDQFEPFGPAGVALGEIGKIEFALNNTSRAATAGSDLFVGPVWYQDRSAPALWPVDGFDAFENEQNWLFVEGTGQMAAATCLAGVMVETQQINVPACMLNERCGFVLGGMDACLYRGVMPGTREIALFWYLTF